MKAIIRDGDMYMEIETDEELCMLTTTVDSSSDVANFWLNEKQIEELIVYLKTALYEIRNR